LVGQIVDWQMIENHQLTTQQINQLSIQLT
jgi:hypothetical protein